MKRGTSVPQRLQLEWISAAEGPKFQRTMQQMEDLRRSVTETEIRHTMEILEADHLRKLAKTEKRAARNGKTLEV